MNNPLRVPEFPAVQPKDEIMTSSHFGTGKLRLRWDHGSKHVEIATNGNDINEAEGWHRMPVSEARDLIDTLTQACEDVEYE